MQHYPTFAFFSRPYSLRRVAAILIERLGSEVPGIRVKPAGRGEEVPLEHPWEALGFLARTAEEPVWMTLSGNGHRISLSPVGENVLAIEIAAPNGSKERGEPNCLAVQHYRGLALRLHSALVESCGALISYSSSLEAQDPMLVGATLRAGLGASSHQEIADEVLDSLDEPSALAQLVGRQPFYFWLLACRPEVLPEGFQVRDQLRTVLDRRQLSILENEIDSPLMMALAS